MGYVEDVRSYLAAADVMVVPSRSEGAPLAVLEAMATGWPIVAFDVAGLSELIDHRDNCFLVAGGDVPGLAEAVLAVFRPPTRRRAGMGDRSLQLAKRCSLDETADLLVDLYGSLAAAVPGPPDP